MSNTTLTVRTDEKLRKALERRAASLGKTISQFVRETLEQAVTDRPIGVLAEHVRGRLELPELTDSWGNQLKERNWRR